MYRVLKYILILSFIAFFTTNSKAQYLCDNEYRVINKQKRQVKKKCREIAKNWVNKNRDSLNIPKKIKLTKLKFKPKKQEIHKEIHYNKWYEIDSLLCVKKNQEYINEAKKRMVSSKLVVYDIHADFNFIPSENDQIQSSLNFEFDIEGNLIRAIIRKKKISPFSGTPYH